MLLSTIKDSNQLSQYIMKEDGNHLEYWLVQDPQAHRELMIQFIDSVFFSTFLMVDRSKPKFNFQVNDACDEPFEMKFDQLNYLLEMMGGSFALCGVPFDFKHKAVKKTLSIYVHLIKSLMHNFRTSKLQNQEESAQKLLRRMISHLSLAFSDIADQNHIQLDIIEVYRQLLVCLYVYMTQATFTQLIGVLMGILHQIVKQTKGRKSDMLTQLKSSTTQTLLLAFIYSGTQQLTLWSTFASMVSQWIKESDIDMVILSRWRSVMVAVTTSLMQILDCNASQDVDSIEVIVQFDDPKKPDTTRITVVDYVLRKKETNMVISLHIQHVMFIWHRFLHLFEGSNLSYIKDSNQYHQYQHKVLTHYIKTIKIIISQFVTYNELQALPHLKRTKAVNYNKPFQAGIRQPVPFDGKLDPNDQLTLLKQNVYIPNGHILLKIFGALLLPNAKYNEAKLYQKLSIKALRALANLFTCTVGPFPVQDLKNFYRVLLSNLKTIDNMKVVKIVTKILRSNLPLQTVLLEPTAQTLLKEYRQMCKELLITEQQDRRKSFNETLVEFLNVYTGRASELLPLQVDSLFKITLESFKFETVTIELYYKMSMIMLHCVKTGKVESVTRSILDISLSTAIRDDEHVIKYLIVAVEFIYMCTVLFQAMMHQNYFYDRTTLKILLQLLLQRVEEFKKCCRTSYAAQKSENKDHTKIRCQNFFISLLQTIYQLCILQPSILDDSMLTKQMIDCINEPFEPFMEPKISEFAAIILKSISHYVGNVQLGQNQFFFNTELDNEHTYQIDAPTYNKRMVYAINKNTIVEFVLPKSSYQKLFLLIRNSFGLNIWHATQYFKFLPSTAQKLILKEQRLLEQRLLEQKLKQQSLLDNKHQNLKYKDTSQFGLVISELKNLQISTDTTKNSNQQIQSHGLQIQNFQSMNGSQESVNETTIIGEAESLGDAEIKSETDRGESINSGSNEINDSILPYNQEEFRYLIFSLLNQIGIMNSYNKNNSIQVNILILSSKALSENEQFQTTLSRSLQKLDQIHFRNMVFVNFFYIDGMNSNSLTSVDKKDIDYKLYNNFVKTLGVKLDDSDLKTPRYQHINWMKNKFTQQQHNPMFWLNEWLYSSTILQEFIYIINSNGMPNDLSHSHDNAEQYQYYNGTTILWVTLSGLDLYEPLLPRVLKQFHEILQDKKNYQLLIIFSVSQKCQHKSKFYRVATIQLTKGSIDYSFDPYLRGPLLNCMCLHEDELKLYIIAFIVNSQRKQYHNHTDQIKKRDREIQKTIEKFASKKKDLQEQIM